MLHLLLVAFLLQYLQFINVLILSFSGIFSYIK